MGFGFTEELESWIKTVSKVSMEIGVHPDDGVDHRTIPVWVRKAKLTYIQVTDTCFEGDDRSYRHVGNLILSR